MQEGIDLNNLILKNATIMYLEDEETLLTEISLILSGFVKEVISAPDGRTGLELYKQRKNDIDLIITDINMPHMNGIEFMAEVRKIDTSIPILICTAFNETENIIKAIKLKVNDYVLKPVQMTSTLKSIYKILEEKHNALMLVKQTKELAQYKAILDNENLVIETSIEGKILYVNDLYCEITGFSKEELIGESNSLIRHPETTDIVAKELWKTISSGNPWHGKMKNLSKEGDTFYVKQTVIPIFNKNQIVEKYMAIGFLITEDEKEKQTLKRFIMQQKGEKVQLEHKYQAKLNIELQKALKNAHSGDINKQNQLVELVNDLEIELKINRDKYNDEKSRMLSMENKLKNANHKLETMQGGYQDRIDQLYKRSQTSVDKFESYQQQNMILENKLEKAQESVNLMQENIDEYRKRIDELTDLVNDYEDKIKASPSF